MLIWTIFWLIWTFFCSFEICFMFFELFFGSFEASFFAHLNYFFAQLNFFCSFELFCWPISTIYFSAPLNYFLNCPPPEYTSDTNCEQSGRKSYGFQLSQYSITILKDDANQFPCLLGHPVILNYHIRWESTFPHKNFD